MTVDTVYFIFLAGLKYAVDPLKFHLQGSVKEVRFVIIDTTIRSFAILREVIFKLYRAVCAYLFFNPHGDIL